MSNNRNIGPDQLAAAFKALSNPHRLRIFAELATCCPPGTRWEGDPARCVGELGNGLGVAPSTLSHHIKELNRSGLVRSERRGRNIVCWVDADMVAALSHFLSPGNGCGQLGKMGDMT